MTDSTTETTTEKPDPAAALAAERAAFEKTTEEAATALIGALPDAIKALVPEKLTAAQRIEWAAKALKTGIGKTNQNQTVSRSAETERLPATAKIAAGYGRK